MPVKAKASVIARAKAAEVNRPGAVSARAKTQAKYVALGFLGVAALALGLQLLGVGTPGMAWYVYQ
jgi:hypothetical protein